MPAQLGRELEADQFHEVLIERIDQSEDDGFDHLLRIRHHQCVVDFHGMARLYSRNRTKLNRVVLAAPVCSNTSRRVVAATQTMPTCCSLRTSACASVNSPWTMAWVAPGASTVSRATTSPASSF